MDPSHLQYDAAPERPSTSIACLDGHHCAQAKPAETRILLVDDDDEGRAAIARALRAEGFAISTASDGAAALAEAGRAPPDLLVTDLCMPGMDGVELCRRLRERDPELPVIVVTGHADTASAIAGLRAGIDDYLGKPLDLDALLHRIAQVLERRNARAEIARLERQRREFLALIAHDLRGPLNAIIMAARVLGQRSDAKATADDPQIIDRLARNAWRMNAMIEEILDSSTLEAGRVELRCVPCDLGAIVEGVVGDLDVAARRRVVLDAASGEARVFAEPSKIERVVTNLVANALKYSSEDEAVRVVVRREADDVVLEVVDHGIGIPEEHLRGLFEPYFRASSGARFAGVGLGLYITRLIVEAHGGRIEVESDVAKGSAFRVFLPSREEA